MPLNRRDFLNCLALAAPAAAIAAPAWAQTSGTGGGAAVLDAASFGVVPDFPDAQTGTLQKAIDAAAEQRLLLRLPSGGISTGTLELRPGSRLAGSGAATILNHDGDGPALSASSARDLMVADLMLAGAPGEVTLGDEHAPLVALEDCSRLSLSGVFTRGGAGSAIELDNCSGAVRGCVIEGARQAGIFSNNAKGLEITGNTVDDCADNGIQVWRSSPGEDGTIIAQNRIRNIGAASGGSGQYGNAINLYRADGVIVSANQVEDCAFTAVRANSASNAQIVNNSCTRLGEVAIYAEFAFEGAVISGNIVDDAASGISITNFNDGGRLAVCTGNLIRNLRFRDHYDRRGNGIGAEADTLISGNVIENAPGIGIALGWGQYLRNVVANANIIRNCGFGVGVSVTTGAGAAVITGNLIAGAKESAIRGFELDKPVGGELLGQAAEKWPHLTISGNVAS